MVRSLAAAICILSVSMTAAPDNARFFRVLKLYSDPVYRATDSKIFLNGEYNARRNDSVPSQTGLAAENDELHVFERTWAHNAGMRVLTLKGDAWFSGRTEAEIGLRGAYFSASQVRSNAVIGREDINQTIDATEHLYGDVAWSRDTYFPVASKTKCYAGLRLWSSTNATGAYSREYTRYELSSASAYLSKTKTGTIEENIGFEPTGGIGKPVFVTPVYRAFEVERSLKEAGAIRGPLSDSTMVQIAQWIAAEFSMNETRDRPRKYVFAMLDTILNNDPAAADSTRSAFALMNAVEKHDNAYPEMFNGLKFFISGGIMVYNGYEERRRTLFEQGDTVTMLNDFGYFSGVDDYFPLFTMEWGKAVSRHFFLSLLATGDFFSLYPDDPFITVASNPWVLIRGMLYYLVNDRFFLDMGFGDLRLDRTWSIRQPDQVWLRGTVFIEEKIGVVLSLVHEYSYHGYPRHSLPYDTHTSVETATDRITLELQYEF
ncbi:MAG: hypothetical protein JW768_00310 [Chitinispirillaceae bacterium]|nr:hypothetical protein [Chitinispirillaceae bacterium]